MKHDADLPLTNKWYTAAHAFFAREDLCASFTPPTGTGQNFYSKSRAAEHDAFLTWLLDRAQEHEVDAIIVAGDIFDTGSPPSYARELYNRFVVQLQQTGCRLVVLAGNHDSVAMLNESRDILAFLHTTVVANAGYAPIELPLRDGTPGAIFCPVPFLRPRELVTSQAGHSGREKQQQLLHAISGYYQEQYQQACALRGYRPLPIIASGHLTTVGASKSDAVRDIYIGTLDAFPAQHFPLPTTLRWAIFTGRRWSAAASISATAARRCR